MLHAVKLLASAAASIVALIAYIPYLVDMFKGKNKPHLYTWISFVVVTGVVGYIQLVGGAGVGAVPTMLGEAVDCVILFYCFRFGTKDIVPVDAVCLAAAIFGVFAYVALHAQPVVALAIVTAAEFASFVPTFRKTRNDPYSESLPSYYLLMLKMTLILVALQKYNLLTISYSALWNAMFVAFLGATYRWRLKTAHKSAKPATADLELEEAPLV